MEKIKKYNSLNHDQALKIFEIWQEVYPSLVCFDCYKDFLDYISTLDNPNHFIFENKGTVVAWLCSFDREGQRYFVIVIDSNYQRQGLGQKLMGEMLSVEAELYGWIALSNDYEKRNGELYPSPEAFYKKYGFVTLDERMIKGELIVHKIQYKKLL